MRQPAPADLAVGDIVAVGSSNNTHRVMARDGDHLVQIKAISSGRQVRWTRIERLVLIRRAEETWAK